MRQQSSKKYSLERVIRMASAVILMLMAQTAVNIGASQPVDAAPGIVLHAPLDGSTVSRVDAMQISGNVENIDTVDRVAMFLNERTIGVYDSYQTMDIGADKQFSFIIPGGSLPDGSYKLTVEAYSGVDSKETSVVNFLVVTPRTITLSEAAYNSETKQMHGSVNITGISTQNDIGVAAEINGANLFGILSATDNPQTYSWQIDMSSVSKVGNNSAYVRAFLNAQEGLQPRLVEFIIEPVKGQEIVVDSPDSTPQVGLDETLMETVPIFSNTRKLSTSLGTRNAESYGFASLFSSDELKSESEPDKSQTATTNSSGFALRKSNDEEKSSRLDDGMNALNLIGWLGVAIVVGLAIWKIATHQQSKIRRAYFQK